jgi:hypothetical protein
VRQIVVTTSELLCGIVGSSLRYELGVFGEGAHRAARLAAFTHQYLPSVSR